jgi:tRNA A-37 threonylcarbamoyl transferase component Bud32
VADLVGVERIGPYELGPLLGKGADGSVYRATHHALGTPAAVKLLHATATDPVARSRFLREARASRRIKGEHVGRVLDAGTEGELLYIAMELIQGDTLRAEIARRAPMPVPAAVELALQLCLGVAEIHSAGWIHRDLKPSNVLIEDLSGDVRRVRIVDFGIVRESQPIDHSAQSSLIAGSPHYMAPEQIVNPRAVEIRTDVWSFGVIFYEMLTGQLPFQAQSSDEYLASVALDPPISVEEHRPGLHPSLRELLTLCLSKNVEKRPADMAAVATHLVTARPSLATFVERVQSILGRRRPPPMPETPSGRIPGAPALVTKQALLDAFGPDVHARALDALTDDEREELEGLTDLGWVRSTTTSAVVNATASLVGMDAELLSDQIARQGSEQAFRGIWQPFGRDVSDEALARRCSVVYAKSRSQGTLEGRLLAAGRMEAILEGWTDARERDLRHIAIALEVVAGLAGREDIRCTWLRTDSGARYECTWSEGNHG